jgi:predicted GIY-YIG superfamily endonuclease
MREERLTAAYMLASRKHDTLYLGSAADLIARVGDHKQGKGSNFTAKYGVTGSSGLSGTCSPPRRAAVNTK